MTCALLRAHPIKCLRPAPASSLSFENLGGLFRPPATGLVVWEVGLVFVRGPLVKYRHDEFPSALGHVLARVERRVAEYAVEYESLVRFGELDAERRAVAKVHVHVAYARDLSGHFRGDAHRDALVGLYAYDELVRRHVLHRAAEELVRRGLELYRDFSDALREALARAYVERHARPAPVVEPHRHGCEGFGHGVGRNVLLLSVAGDGLAADGARAVLPAHALLSNALGRELASGVHCLNLLVAHVLGRERGGRLHRDDRENLKDVVLNHVAHDARFFVVAAAPLDAHRLGVRYLHVIYVLPIPHRLEDGVGEAEDE